MWDAYNLRMKNLFKLLCCSLTCALTVSCSDDVQESHESYLNGIYSNYSDSKQSNLDVTYNGEVVKDKEVSVSTMDNLIFNITFKNILKTSDVLFNGVILQKSNNVYIGEKDSIVNGRDVHCDIKIETKYDQTRGDESNANMILNVGESDVK